MADDSHVKNMAQRILQCFNTGSVSCLAQTLHHPIAVNSAILGLDRRSSTLVHSPLERLIVACNSQYPGITFFDDVVQTVSDGFILRWRARFRSEESGCMLQVPCSCRVRLQDRTIREIRFSMDEYEMLRQLGRVCAEPGQATDNVVSKNRVAADSMFQAIRGRRNSCGAFGHNLVVHASIEVYKNINEGFDKEVFRVDGVGVLERLLDHFRSTFHDPLALSFSEGISQGQTTTFRGKIHAKVGTQAQRYDIVCGFVSDDAVVTECWIKVTPPLTLMECLI